MPLEFQIDNDTANIAQIKVVGGGGAGGNAVNRMIDYGLKGVEFISVNTDHQALYKSKADVKVQIGEKATGKLGAGSDPAVGKAAAEESRYAITDVLRGADLVFITAGMGGGTGTGAAPVIAKMAKDKGILTVAVVTLPFLNEGNEALSRAIDGIHELEKNVDSLLIINNEKLHEFFGNQLIQDAFPQADEVLATAVRSIVEIIKKPGHINVDFKDVETMMRNSGMALMGCGVGSGQNRIEDAVKSAFESPLLNDFDLKSAKKVLVNITCGHNDQGLTMNDLNNINIKISEYTGRANNFKRGLIWDDDPNIGDTIKITSIVTGLHFSDVIGQTRDMGNYIMINKDFKYDKTEMSQTEGISLVADSSSQQIGFNTKSNVCKFKFDPDQKPALILDKGEGISELENIPAIRRIQQ